MTVMQKANEKGYCDCMRGNVTKYRKFQLGCTICIQEDRKKTQDHVESIEEQYGCNYL